MMNFFKKIKPINFPEILISRKKKSGVVLLQKKEKSGFKFPKIKFPNLYRPWQLYVLLSLGLCVLGYWFFKTNPYNPASIAPPKKSESNIEVSLKKVKIIGRKDGIPFFTIVSDKVDISKPDQRFIYFREKPGGSFYNLKNWDKPITDEPPDRYRTFTWKAGYAEFDNVAENLTLRDKIKIVTDDKDVLTTDILRWVNNEDKIYCDSKTKIVGHKGTPIIIADQLTGDIKLDVLNLKGNVSIVNTVNSIE